MTTNCVGLPFPSHFKKPGERSCGAVNGNFMSYFMSYFMKEIPYCKEKISLSAMDPILCPGHSYLRELEAATKSERPQSLQQLGKEWLNFQSFDWGTTLQENSQCANISTWRARHEYLSDRVKRHVIWLWSEFLAMKMWRERGEEGHCVVKDKHIWCMQSSRARKLIFSSKNWLSPGEILLSKNKIYSN